MFNCRFRHLRHETNLWMSQINWIPARDCISEGLWQCQLQIIHHFLLCGVVCSLVNWLIYSVACFRRFSSEVIIENRYVVQNLFVLRCCSNFVTSKKVNWMLCQPNYYAVDRFASLTSCDDTIELNKHSSMDFIGIEFRAIADGPR